MSIIVNLKLLQDLKFTIACQHQKLSSRYKIWGYRGLEIYDRPKILNCNLYFVTFIDVYQQMNI